MATLTHSTLAQEVSADVAKSAKWYAAAAVAGAIGGGIFGFFDYSPPPAPTKTSIAAPEVTPLLKAPIEEDAGETSDGALVAQRSYEQRRTANRGQARCVEQVSPAGATLGVLCVPDPGGVKGSAVGSITR
jgi:hypothetical protein